MREKGYPRDLPLCQHRSRPPLSPASFPWSCRQQPSEKAELPSMVPGLGDPAWPQNTSPGTTAHQVWHICFILLSRLQTHEAILIKGRLRLLGRKAGLSGTGSFPPGNCPVISRALTVSWHLRRSSVPGRCITGGCLGPGFIAGEPDYPTYSPG